MHSFSSGSVSGTSWDRAQALFTYSFIIYLPFISICCFYLIGLTSCHHIFFLSYHVQCSLPVFSVFVFSLILRGMCSPITSLSSRASSAAERGFIFLWCWLSSSCLSFPLCAEPVPHAVLYISLICFPCHMLMPLFHFLLVHFHIFSLFFPRLLTLSNGHCLLLGEM